MARGFESKDVEFQQAEAERVKQLGRELTSEERDAQAKRAIVELSLARARADLAAARTPAPSGCVPPSPPEQQLLPCKGRDRAAKPFAPGVEPSVTPAS
jgi:hypothetical protein